MSYQEQLYAKLNNAPAKTMNARKSLIMAFQEFQDKCADTNVSESDYMDQMSTIFLLLSKSIRNYALVYGVLRQTWISDLVSHFYTGKTAVSKKTSDSYNFLPVELTGQIAELTFYRGGNLESLPSMTFSSDVLIRPYQLSVLNNHEFWAAVVRLVHTHGRLDDDFDPKIRARKDWPIYWASLGDSECTCLRYTMKNPNMYVVCYDHEKVVKKHAIVKKDTDECYYVVDLSFNHLNILSGINVWFKGPRHMYGSSYYHRITNSHQFYDTLTLVNSVDLCKFKIDMNDVPLVCF